ncbi:T9SS type A sorting domain-containing protein [Nonlabens sp. Hel1_33_55]|uniref:T9SS type A sorting domain-containing protein n=1 Tax=Nonlabens sp. Hel1_33_55 TaxID=1336802 RepID=UPI0012FD84F8|nr:T9SS type A sorting domain-containing protein [Nonlabens sp. Hel1_33_55]
MIKITYFFILLFSTVVCAQDLTIMSGGSISMETGAQLYINGVELQPSINYAFEGPNEVTSTVTPVNNPKSVSKVMEWSNPVESYMGMVYFKYENVDLNELEEADLGLSIKDLQSEWIIMDSNLDVESKRVGFDFADPTHITAITATRKQTLGTSSIQDAGIQIFPNPTTSTITINYGNEINVEVYNLLGNTLFYTTNKVVDLSNLSSGTYLIKITDVETSNAIYRKILKR